MLEKLTIADFSARIGETFRLTHEQGQLDLEVIAVDAVGAPPSEGLRQAFSVLLRGPAEPLLEQGTRGFDHPELGKLDLFMVPLGPDETGQRYELAFG